MEGINCGRVAAGYRNHGHRVDDDGSDNRLHGHRHRSHLHVGKAGAEGQRVGVVIYQRLEIGNQLAIDRDFSEMGIHGRRKGEIDGVGLGERFAGHGNSGCRVGCSGLGDHHLRSGILCRGSYHRESGSVGQQLRITGHLRVEAGDSDTIQLQVGEVGREGCRNGEMHRIGLGQRAAGHGQRGCRVGGSGLGDVQLGRGNIQHGTHHRQFGAERQQHLILGRVDTIGRRYIVSVDRGIIQQNIQQISTFALCKRVVDGISGSAGTLRHHDGGRGIR